MDDKMNWIDEREKVSQEERSKDYFKIVEGDQKFQLLSHCAPLFQKWTGSRYEYAQEGEENVSVKGVCWVLQDGEIKSATLPYTVVKSIRSLQNNEDWNFELPFEHVLTLTAKGAGTKEVEYTLTASPKKTPFDAEILKELESKPSPEEIIEKMRAKAPPKSESSLSNEAKADILSSENSPF